MYEQVTDCVALISLLSPSYSPESPIFSSLSKRMTQKDNNAYLELFEGIRGANGMLLMNPADPG